MPQVYRGYSIVELWIYEAQSTAFEVYKPCGEYLCLTFDPYRYIDEVSV